MPHLFKAKVFRIEISDLLDCDFLFQSCDEMFLVIVENWLILFFSSSLDLYLGFLMLLNWLLLFFYLCWLLFYCNLFCSITLWLYTIRKSREFVIMKIGKTEGKNIVNGYCSWIGWIECWKIKVSKHRTVKEKILYLIWLNRFKKEKYNLCI